MKTLYQTSERAVMDRSSYPATERTVMNHSSYKIHVVHIVYSFGIGGLENGIVNLINNMNSEKFKVSIISLTPMVDSKSRITRKDVICEVLKKREGNDPSVPFRLAKILRKYRVDVVHTHGWGTYLEGLFAAWIARVPVVLHGEHGTDQLDWLRRRMAYRLGLVGTNKVLTVCENMRSKFIERYHIRPDKIKTVRNGVDTRFFEESQELRECKRRELGFGEDDIVVGTIGRLCYEKNYETLLKASALVAAKHKNFSLLIIGDGADRESLLELTNSLGINGKIQFLGNRNDTLGLLNAMDVFVLTSRSEGLPNTLLEAMSVGVPVVTTNVGGIPEVITDSGFGFLVEPHDPEMFAEALEKLISSRDLRFQMGNSGKCHINSKFALEGMVKEYEQTYTELTDAQNAKKVSQTGTVNHEYSQVGKQRNGNKQASRTSPRSDQLTDPYSVVVRNCVLPWVSVFTQSDFWKIYRNFSSDAKVFRPDRPEVLEKVQALLTHSYHHVPFYRERMDRLGIAPDSITTLVDLQQIPPTTKADIVANFPDRFTADPKVFSPWRYVSTSGTIERMTVIQDFRKRDFVRATQLLSLKVAANYEPGMRYMEIPPDICVNVCGTSDSVEPSLLTYLWDNFKGGGLSDPEVISNLWGLMERQIMYRRLQLPALGSEGLAQKDSTLTEYLKKIDDYRPHVLKALPVYLYLLALHILKHQLPPPRITGCLMPMGSSMTPYMKDMIQLAFQRPVHEDYGCAELGSVAVECGHQRGLHPFSSLFFVEVVNNGRPARAGEVGKVLITDLLNFAMPLIRYDIGDVALVHEGPCDCGNPGLRFEVQGRIHDCLLAKDGSILTSDRIIDSVIRRENVIGLQLEVPRHNELHLQIVPSNGASLNIQETTESLNELLGDNWKIFPRVVPTILPEPGGKYRFVKNHVRTVNNCI